MLLLKLSQMMAGGILNMQCVMESVTGYDRLIAMPLKALSDFSWLLCARIGAVHFVHQCIFSSMKYLIVPSIVLCLQ